MQLTDRAKKVEDKPLSFAERTYLPSILKGMGITIKHMFQKNVTYQYPEEPRVFAPVFRGLHVLKRDAQGRERCTACGLCALACPAEAITMTAAERRPGEENLYREEKYASKYEINMLRCIFCGLCEEACPKEAIFLTNTIASANYNRDTFVYGKDRLVEPVGHPQDQANHLNVQEEAYREEWHKGLSRKKNK